MSAYKDKFRHWLFDMINTANKNHELYTPILNADNFNVSDPVALHLSKASESNTYVTITSKDPKVLGAHDITYHRHDLSVVFSKPLKLMSFVPNTIHELLPELSKAIGIELAVEDLEDGDIVPGNDTYQIAHLVAKDNSYWVTGKAELLIAVELDSIVKSQYFHFKLGDVTDNVKAAGIAEDGNRNVIKQFTFLGNAKNIMKCNITAVHKKANTGFIIQGAFSFTKGSQEYTNVEELRIDKFGMVVHVSQEMQYGFLNSIKYKTVEDSHSQCWYQYAGARLLRFKHTGAIDTDFIAEITGEIHSVTVAPNGNILVAVFQNEMISIIKLLPTGKRYPGFSNITIETTNGTLPKLQSVIANNDTIYTYISPSVTLDYGSVSPVINGCGLVADNQYGPKVWNPVAKFNASGSRDAFFRRLFNNRYSASICEYNPDNKLPEGIMNSNKDKCMVLSYRHNPVTGAVNLLPIAFDEKGNIQLPEYSSLELMPYWVSISDIQLHAQGDITVIGTALTVDKNETLPPSKIAATYNIDTLASSWVILKNDITFTNTQLLVAKRE